MHELAQKVHTTFQEITRHPKRLAATGLLGLALLSACAEDTTVPVNFPIVDCKSPNPTERKGSLWTNAKGGINVNGDIINITPQGEVIVKTKGPRTVKASEQGVVTLEQDGKVYTAYQKDDGTQVDASCTTN